MRPVEGELFDVAIVGGGPAGSTTAAYLRMNGYQTVLLEKAKFPRFHVGESLLPVNLDIFDELGVRDRIRESGATPKRGAEFRSRCGEHVRKFYFRDSLLPDRPLAYQVLRSKFDSLLLARAREGGADVREESPVTAVSSKPHGHELTVKPRRGAAYRLSARCVVDASGQDTFLATRLGLKRLDPEHRRYAVFGHFRGVERGKGDDAGNIIIVPFGEGHWLWSIPLPDERTSIGAVVTRALVAEHGDDLEGFLLRTIRETPALAARIGETGLELEPTEPVRVAADFSYEATSYAGDGFLLVGDAAAFLDPVFSSGVLLAMSSARDAAAAIHGALERGDVSYGSFRDYERCHRRKVRTISRLIRAFYRPAFLEMFMNPTDVLGLRGAVTTLLSGELDVRFGARLRLELFYLIGKLRNLALDRYPENALCTLGCSTHTKESA